MKISLHIEADTPAEFQLALDVLHAQQARVLATDLLEEDLRELEEEDRREASKAKPAPKAKKVAPQEEAPAVTRETPVVEPDPVVEQPVEPVVEPVAEPVKAKRGRPAKDKPNGSTVAETPAVVPAKGDVSRQDMLDAFAEYVQRYGANFGYTDISNILQRTLGDGVRKASDVPDDKLPLAIGAIEQAIADNPFNRKRDYA